jgi:hypothetical protein
MADAGPDVGGAGHGAEEPRRPVNDMVTAKNAHAALVRVICRRVRVSGSARALAACLYTQPTHKEEEDLTWTVSVEAVGSGAVLVPALQLDPASTVGALRANIASLKNGTAVRLFVGQGGPELTEAAKTHVSDSSLWDGATVVVAAAPCESCGDPRATQMCKCKVATCCCCALKCPSCGHDACRNCVTLYEEPRWEGTVLKWTCPKCRHEERYRCRRHHVAGPFTL